MADKKSEITENGAIDLEESALDGVVGGAATEWKVSEMDGKSNTLLDRASETQWKVKSFDGKGNDVVTEDIVFVTETIKRG